MPFVDPPRCRRSPAKAGVNGVDAASLTWQRTRRGRLVIDIHGHIRPKIPIFWHPSASFYAESPLRRPKPVLLGTDCPFGTVDESVRYLRAAVTMARRSGLPEIPARFVDAISERDSRALPGLG